MKQGTLEKIQNLAVSLQLVTVEDMRKHSLPQLVTMIANKLNELMNEVHCFETDVIEMVETQNENIQYFLGEGLYLEVATVFENWMEDGTFNTLINQTALKKVNDRIDETNTQLSNLYTLISDVDNMQQMINNSNGSVKFKKGSYQLKSNIFLKSDTIYDGNGSTINMNDFSFILPEFSSNIKLINFNFIGTLKHTKITELLENGTKIKCENNVFDIGDKLGCSNYGKTDKPYATIISFDGTYYKLDTSISSTGELLNNDFGAVVGNFEWTSSISGLHNTSHITIKNCKFEYARGYAISLPESDHIILDGVEIKNNGLDMINLSAERVDRFDLTIENCNLEKSIDFGKQGVVISSIDGGYYKNIKISKSTFRNISESAISFGYARGHLQDVVIKENVFTDNILFAIHLSGDYITIKDNIIQGSQAGIRITDINSETYSPSASCSNLFIQNNNITKCLNGIISTQVRTTSGVLMPTNTHVINNLISVDYSAIEVSGENIIVRGNNIYSENNNGEPYYASSIFVNGEHNENVLIDNNIVGGEVNIIWLNTFNMKIQNNTIKADKSKAIRILPKDTTDKQNNMNCVVCNNVIYKSNNMNLSTNDGKDLTEFVDNKLVNGELITIIPYMKGHGCRYEGDGDGIHWISNTDNSWKYTKDRYFESYGKYLYIGSDGTPKITDDITSTE